MTKKTKELLVEIILNSKDTTAIDIVKKQINENIKNKSIPHWNWLKDNSTNTIPIKAFMFNGELHFCSQADSEYSER